MSCSSMPLESEPHLNKDSQHDNDDGGADKQVAMWKRFLFWNLLMVG